MKIWSFRGELSRQTSAFGKTDNQTARTSYIQTAEPVCGKTLPPILCFQIQIKVSTQYIHLTETESHPESSF
jgi:hypothetical protein